MISAARRQPATEERAEFGSELRFLRALWELDHALESASRRMKSAVGVTGRERLIIRIVGQREGIAPGELAALLHVHPSTVTASLKRLERKRLVERRRNERDARSSQLGLTPSGRRIQALRSGTIEAAIRAALSGVPPRDVAAATQLLGAVAQRLATRARGARRPLALPTGRRAGRRRSRRS